MVATPDEFVVAEPLTAVAPDPNVNDTVLPETPALSALSVAESVTVSPTVPLVAPVYDSVVSFATLNV